LVRSVAMRGQTDKTAARRRDNKPMGGSIARRRRHVRGWSVTTDKLAVDECAKSLETLTRLACNPECISTLVDGLVPSLAAILDVAEHQDASGFDRLVCCLLNEIVKVSHVRGCVENVEIKIKKR